MSYNIFETILSPNSDKALSKPITNIKQQENIKLRSGITGVMSCLIKTKKAAEHFAVFVLKMREREISRTLPGDVTTSALLKESLRAYRLFHRVHHT